MKKTKLLSLYKIALAVFALALVLMPKNVTAMPEIETKLLLTAIGIDKTPDGYTVSATDVMPAESQDGTLRRLSVKADGGSVSECLHKLSVKTGKKLELGLCGLVAIGNTYDEESVLPDLRYLLSSGKIIAGAYLAYCPNSRASDVLEKANALSAAGSNGLATLLEHNDVGNGINLVTLLKFLSDSASVSESSYMPCIEITEKSSSGCESPSGEDSGEDTKSGSGEKKNKNETEIGRLGEVALFRGGKKVLILGESQTRGLTWLDEKSTRGQVALENFTVRGADQGALYASLTDKRVSLKTRFTSRPVVKIKLSARLSLEDRSKLTELNTVGGVSEEEISKAMLAAYKEKIKSEIQAFIDSTKAVNCDAVGLSDLLHRTQNKKYKEVENSENFYSEIQTEYDISVKIN